MTKEEQNEEGNPKQPPPVSIPPLESTVPEDDLSLAFAANDELLDVSFTNHSRRDHLNMVSAAREDSFVWKFRLLTAFLLVCAGVAVCLTVTLLAKRNEKDSFEVAFQELGGQLVSSFEQRVIDRVGIVDKFATELTTESMGANGSTAWPFFTPAHYEVRAEKTAKLAQLTQLFLLPKVVNTSKNEWIKYSKDNQDWIAEGLAAQGKLDPTNFTSVIPFIYIVRQGKPSLLSASDWPFFFPVWTQYPAARRTLTNLNPYGTEESFERVNSVLTNRQPSFPRSLDYWQDPDLEGKFGYQRFKLTYPDYEGDPFCTTFYPVYESHDKDAEIVAVLMGGIIWKTLFESILPQGTGDVHVYLENQCDRNYTYLVGGNQAQFLDYGDLHDSQYDHLELSTDIHSILGYGEDVEINRGNCAYGIRVYPTKPFEQSFYTNQPRNYALAMAAIFLVTCCVFLLYDYMVERRQAKVMKAALQSGNLVSSLFPEDVRKRLYEEEEAKRNRQSKDKTSTSIETVEASKANAIATLYPETTIFFADLAGFTKWSSTRTPVEVFDLLEAIYSKFDKLARHFKVFKVETIGDCYVAVTGLPEAQPDHAIRMCKFAASCKAKFRVLTAEVAPSLGEDTRDLEMRVGLHSGPVTAGVLRGEKSRFQLFGDSVNTASRMESNGVKGKIHVSEATAEELRSSGKEGWLTPREDKIVAKGKGKMQTYWVQVSATPTPSMHSMQVTSQISEISLSTNNSFASGLDLRDVEC